MHKIKVKLYFLRRSKTASDNSKAHEQIAIFLQKHS